MASRKIPKVGDRVVHHEPHFNRSTEGTVTLILSAQFAYETDNGNHRLCLFNENWAPIGNKK